MKKQLLFIILVFCILLCNSNVWAKTGFFLGVQAGYSAQNPSFKNLEFNKDTTYLLGARAGVKFFVFAVEVNYFKAAHNLSIKEIGALDWGDARVDYHYIGLNLKYFFPILVFNPYLTAGYGYYTADIRSIDKDTEKGFNLGLGFELNLGSTFALMAEGKYHQAKLDIDDTKLKFDNFTICGGITLYF
jgi:opacity protein-like surface antigen